jgi:hypothetical protein
VHILRHRTSENVSLIYQSPDGVKVLDLTGSYLRDVSPDQVKFFSDINVSSAMTISLVVEDDLWELITYHSYGRTIVEVPPPLREACRNIGQCASSQVERLLLLKGWKLEYSLQLAFQESLLPHSSLPRQAVFFRYLRPVWYASDERSSSGSWKAGVIPGSLSASEILSD